MNIMTIWPIGHSHGMMEWWWNEVYFRTKGLALNQKYPSFHPHSVIPSSFLNDETDWNEVRMSRMTIEWYPSIVIFIPCHFLAFWNDEGMTEWGGMKVFLEVDKNTEFWDTSHPATIRSFQPHSFVLKLSKILLRNDVRMTEMALECYHSIIPSWNINNQTGSLRGRQRDQVFASDISRSVNLIPLPPP